LASGSDRHEARQQVTDAIDRVIEQWAQPV